MTRKDYILLAEAINSLRPDLPTDDMTDYGLDRVVDALQTVLAADNSRFDAARFAKACGA
jgi:hypothetical protein